MINTLFIVLTWIIALVATFGPLAVILGMIFVPAVAVPLISKIAKAFFDCIPCMIAAAVVVACVGSYWVGHHQAASDCRAAELEAVLRNQKIDLENANKAAADEADRAINIEVTADEQRKKDAAYIKALESRPGCALDDSDIGGVPNDKSGPRRKKSSAGAR